MADATEMLSELVADLIARSGGVVERTGGSALEYAAPEAVSQTLGIAEFGCLSFGPEPVESAQRITFESDWIERLEGLLGSRGKGARAGLELAVPPISDPARVLDRGLVFHNAIYRLIDTTPAWTSYVLLAFRYTAVSDEKRTGLVQMLLNLGTGSALDGFAEEFRLALYETGERESDRALSRASGLSAMWSRDRMARAVRNGLPGRIGRDLSQFVSGMQRRLDRDHSRLIDYYEGLRQESTKKASKKGGDPERERTRIDAILREYQAKVLDLGQKYALTIEVKPIQTIELTMPVRRFNLTVKRRKAERRMSLDWNPLVKKLEPAPCEYSFTAEPGRLLCDEALHIVSPPGLAPCSGCGKDYCRVCHPRLCPRCKQTAPSA